MYFEANIYFKEPRKKKQHKKYVKPGWAWISRAYTQNTYIILNWWCAAQTIRSKQKKPSDVFIHSEFGFFVPFSCFLFAYIFLIIFSAKQNFNSVNMVQAEHKKRRSKNYCWREKKREKWPKLMFVDAKSASHAQWLHRSFFLSLIWFRSTFFCVCCRWVSQWTCCSFDSTVCRFFFAMSYENGQKKKLSRILISLCLLKVPNSACVFYFCVGQFKVSAGDEFCSCFFFWQLKIPFDLTQTDGWQCIDFNAKIDAYVCVRRAHSISNCIVNEFNLNEKQKKNAQQR